MSTIKSTTPYDKYALNTKHTIAARSSVAVPLRRSQTLTVINTHGTQVIDFWAFLTPDRWWMAPSFSSPAAEGRPTSVPIHHSTSHTRASTLHLSPLPNDVLVTNRRTPMLKLIRDTTPGVHDTLIPACDQARYAQLGVPEETYHANCVDNLHDALATLGLALPDDSSPPDPLNLFMNIPVVVVPPPPPPPPPTSPSSLSSQSQVSAPTAQTAKKSNNLTAGADLKWEAPVCDRGGSVVFEALTDCVVVMSACPQDLIKVNNMEPTEAHFLVQE